MSDSKNLIKLHTLESEQGENDRNMSKKPTLARMFSDSRNLMKLQSIDSEKDAVQLQRLQSQNGQTINETDEVEELSLEENEDVEEDSKVLGDI